MDYLPVYLEELDSLLLGHSDDCMRLSQLDGFLTGVLVSPDMIAPSTWLPRIWSGEDRAAMPQFEDEAELQHFCDLVMRHYNTILAALNQPGSFEPVLELDTRNGDTLWEMWIEGFVQAMGLAPQGWRQTAKQGPDEIRAVLEGIATLNRIATGEAAISEAEEDRWDQEAPDLIAAWVDTLHQWRIAKVPHDRCGIRGAKVGRNDPCPCGSGKKYKKCCGLN